MADTKRFSTPKRRLVFERHSLDKNKNRHEKCIKDHYLNHSVSMVIPNYSYKNATKHFQNRPVHDDFCVAVLPVHTFIEKGFIEKFIKQGHLYALSNKTHIDTGNCVAVIPTGVLILSLVKDTYEELGLTGKQSIFQKKMRFIVEIDLKSSTFYPGKSNYDRVSWCLKKSAEMEFEFLISWCDKAGKTNAEAIQSHFSCYNCQCIRNTENIMDLTNLLTPVLNPDHATRVSDDNASDVCSLYEWLGGFHCDIDCSTGSPDSYTSTLTCPKPCIENEKIVKCQWTGLITSQRILNLLESARIVLQSSTNPPPWVAINVWGFSDNPVTWLSNEHGFQYGGENMYTFVVFPDNQYWFFAALGSYDICS